MVSDDAQAQDREYGLLYSTSTSSYVVGVQRIGAQFDPLDGYVAQNDIFGYQSLLQHTFNFTPSFWLHDIGVTNYFARYNNNLGLLSRAEEEVQVRVDLKDLLTVKLYGNPQGVRTVENELLPLTATVSTSGIAKTRTRRRTCNTPAARTTTANSTRGHICPRYPSPAESTSRSRPTRTNTSPPIRAKFRPINGWNVRHSTGSRTKNGSSTPAFGASLARISPTRPNAIIPKHLFAGVDLNFATGNPYQSGYFVDAGNVSLALHYLRGPDEFYFVYGNANNLNTEPALFVEWILYIGAQKGQSTASTPTGSARIHQVETASSAKLPRRCACWLGLRRRVYGPAGTSRRPRAATER